MSINIIIIGLSKKLLMKQSNYFQLFIALVLTVIVACKSNSSSTNTYSDNIIHFNNDAENNQSNNCSICGHICYPSDYKIPAMRIYAKNITLNKLFSLTTEENDTSYIINNLPHGEYIVYAYTVDLVMGQYEEQKEKAKGGYTYLVPCGLTVECKNHNLIPIQLESNKSVRHIDICDWYGAITPSE